MFFQAGTCLVRNGYRPKRDLNSVFFSLWLLYESKIPTNYTMQMILYFWIKIAEIESTTLDENANALFWSCIVFGNLLDQVYTRGSINL